MKRLVILLVLGAAFGLLPGQGLRITIGGLGRMAGIVRGAGWEALGRGPLRTYAYLAPLCGQEFLHGPPTPAQPRASFPPTPRPALGAPLPSRTARHHWHCHLRRAV